MKTKDKKDSKEILKRFQNDDVKSKKTKDKSEDVKRLDNKKRNELVLKVACELLGMMNMEINDAFVEDIESSDDEEQILVGLVVSDPGPLIGYRGRNLASLQLMLALIVKQKLGYWVRTLVDVNGYRKEQEKRLTGIAKSACERVKNTGTSVALGEMSSYERRICHMALQDEEGIVTESEGEGLGRHVVIKLKNL